MSTQAACSNAATCGASRGASGVGAGVGVSKAVGSGGKLQPATVSATTTVTMRRIGSGYDGRLSEEGRAVSRLGRDHSAGACDRDALRLQARDNPVDADAVGAH